MESFCEHKKLLTGPLFVFILFRDRLWLINTPGSEIITDVFDKNVENE